MMNIFTVPLASAQPQIFSVVLGGIRYTITLRWNDVMNVWILDIGDKSGKSLANGIAVVSGVDLVNQLNYLGFSGALIAQSSTDANDDPTYKGLGATDRLFYIPYGQDGQTDFVR
jgi:hypothetical protein